jgi:recombination protein RecA
MTTRISFLHTSESASPVEQQRRSDFRADQWQWTTFTGRLSEFSASRARATLTLACRLVLDAQFHTEPVAWITQDTACFFPPDFATSGVDLDALVVVRVPDGRAVARAADMLLRSGGFGLIVLDLGQGEQVPLPLQSRLAGLARTHATAVLFLTRKPPTAPSMSSFIALRGEARRQQVALNHFVCTLSVLKDKRWGLSWTHVEAFHGPAGLR